MDKKAQVSVEVIVILSIFIVGAILFGVYYISITRRNIDVSANIDMDPAFQVHADFDLQLTDLDPSSSTFNIKAEVNNYPPDKSVYIINVDRGACTNPSLTLPIPMPNASGVYSATLSGFSCPPGPHTITVIAEVSENPPITSTESIIKTI